MLGQRKTERENKIVISKITDQLYLSQVIDVLGADLSGSAKSLQTLEQHGITHIISVCPEPDLIEKETNLFDSSNNGFTFHSIPVPTSQAQPHEDPWIKGLNKAIDKVAAIFQQTPTAKILVHCIEGIDRSPYIVATIIARQKNIALNQAYQIVKSQRPIIHEHYEWLNA
jgi:protein-tyrosine phosphatase